MGLNTVEQTVADVLFDLDSLTLVGRYGDQLSAHRAKRVWQKTLQDCFLLDVGNDIVLRVVNDFSTQQFLLVCEFESSCARYAFWRLTNHHVPEAAYIIETAHIPQSATQASLSAPDMRAMVEQEMHDLARNSKGLMQKLGDFTRSIVKSL